MTPGSGNGWVKKNDVRTPDLSLEAKYTDAKSFSLKVADLEKGEEYALADGRDFAFVISFSGREWVVLNESDYAHLRECARLYNLGEDEVP